VYTAVAVAEAVWSVVQ